MIAVRAVTAAETRPLRSALLRPGQPPEALVYAGDDHPQALHAGAFEQDGGSQRLVGIAMVYPESPPEAHRGAIPEEAFAVDASFRLRGMATVPELQGRSIGRRVLERCFRHVREEGAAFLWCNARSGALTFYRALGLEIVGPEFEIAGIGPHYVMWGRMA